MRERRMCHAAAPRGDQTGSACAAVRWPSRVCRPRDSGTIALVAHAFAALWSAGDGDPRNSPGARLCPLGRARPGRYRPSGAERRARCRTPASQRCDLYAATRAPQLRAGWMVLACQDYLAVIVGDTGGCFRSPDQPECTLASHRGGRCGPLTRCDAARPLNPMPLSPTDRHAILAATATFQSTCGPNRPRNGRRHRCRPTARCPAPANGITVATRQTAGRGS